MSVEIEVRYDRERGCGWRKGGGLYLISGGVSQPCGKLPLPLEKCPTCSHGIKFTRGWTWVDGDALFRERECAAPPENCVGCQMNVPLFGEQLGRCGLLWIGEAFYKTPADWLKESKEQGISRRISTVPNDFEVGKTWVLVAHNKAIAEPCKLQDVRSCEVCEGSMWHYTPAVFQLFKPQAIEYVVKGDETEEELERLVKRGITPVRIERAENQPDLIAEAVS
jgi:hypothetical protein